MRGIACTAEQVMVTSGSQQATSLAARLLADAGDAAWVEDPAYAAGRNALSAAGLRTVPVPVDMEGLDVAAGEASAAHARLALVTPSLQYPLGAVMSLRRRFALLAWASAPMPG
uniref:Aminotransferase class I/II-fold pyridoxal phosphate-dependent enzyme n=1 Tax=Bosea sp. NBC_00436 TaxID=2969620 RepID=A0A9E8CJT1_9HYPH